MFRKCYKLMPQLRLAPLHASLLGLLHHTPVTLTLTNTCVRYTHSGDRGELLRGPLYYVLVLVGVTAVFWRTHPAGLVAVSLVCGGDGLADIVGRRWGGSNKLPWNGDKSWAGTLAMFGGGGAMALG